MPDSFDPTTGEIVAPGMPPRIAAAIVAVKKQVKQLGFDDRNEHGKYKFVSVDKFYEVVGQLMAEAGLALMIDEVETEVAAGGKEGNPWLFTRYELCFVHESGAMTRPVRRSCALPMTGPQTYGSAQSYIEKQFLRQVFKVPTGERDADETAPSADAPSRAGPERRPPPARQQAAPVSADRDKALAEWRRMRDEIDACVTIPEVDALLGSHAFGELRRLSEQVSPTAAAAVGQLEARAETHKANLMGGANAPGSPF